MATRWDSEGPRDARRPWTRAYRLLVIGAAFYLALLMVAYFAGAAGIRRHHVEAGWFWFVALAILYTLLAGRGRDVPATVLTGSDIGRLAALGVTLAWLAYWPSLGLGLLSDDFVLLRKALEGSFWLTENELFRPLPLMLWRMAWSVAGAPWILHALNISLHGVASALAGRLAHHAGFSRLWAGGVTAAVALQPYNVEAVVWVSGLQDLLMAALVLSAVALAPRSGPTPIAGVALATGAALLSKETAIITPALMVVFWWPVRQRRGRLWRNVGVATTVVGGYLLLRLATMAPAGDYLRAPSRYLIKELIVRPFSTLGLPWHGHLVAAHPALAAAFALLPVLLLAVAVARTPASVRKAMPSALWILLAVAPVYTYFFISPDLEGSRYLYLAAPGWILMLATLLRGAVPPAAGAGWLPGAIAAITLCAWGAGLAANTRPWVIAAQIRDRVLAEARRASGNAGCGTLSFEAVPDSFDGAYIFRNGWPEATRAIPRQPDGPDCRFRWNAITRTWERPGTPPPPDRPRPSARRTGELP